MKCVCISCFDYYATRINGISSFFKANGYDIDYLIADFNHLSKKKHRPIYSEINTIHLSVPKYKKNISIKRIISHLVFSIKVYFALKKAEPQIIYCIFPPNMLVKMVSRYKKKHGGKVVFDCYDMWPESFPYSKRNKVLDIFFKTWANIRNKNLTYADLIISVSDEGVGRLKNIADQIPIVTVRPFVFGSEIPCYLFDYEERNEVRFLYLGNINHILDTCLLLSFLKAFSKKKKTILNIIGGGQYLNDLVDDLNNCEIETHMYGTVFDDEAKKAIFSNCDFGLSFPKKEVNSSMPLKVIEYMRFGLPFICANVSGDVQEIVKTKRIAIELCNDNVEDTVELISNLRDNEIKTMSLNCREAYIDYFGNQDYETVFSSILNPESI